MKINFNKFPISGQKIYVLYIVTDFVDLVSSLISFFCKVKLDHLFIDREKNSS